jgi:hypothetical protein
MLLYASPLAREGSEFQLFLKMLIQATPMENDCTSKVHLSLYSILVLIILMTRVMSKNYQVSSARTDTGNKSKITLGKL